MLISEIFKPDNIKINVESRDKEELFEELANFLVEKERLDNREEILSSLWNRERKMTTGIAPNIAIPHTHIKNIGRTVGVLGISKSGIDYDSLDKKPVHLIMMLVGDDTNAAGHLNILKNIAMLLNLPDFYAQILKASSAAQVNETIIEYEEMIKYSKK